MTMRPDPRGGFTRGEHLRRRIADTMLEIIRYQRDKKRKGVRKRETLELRKEWEV